MGYEQAIRHGWRIFPLRPGTKQPAVYDWERWASNNPDPAWWAEEGAGYGIACGPSNLIVLDIDRHGEIDGIETYADLCARHHPHRSTYKTKTPSGGIHYYYRQPPRHKLHNTASKLAPGVDTRGFGGYVVGYPPDNATPVMPCPVWLAQLLAVVRPSQPADPQYHRHVLRSSHYGIRSMLNESQAIRTAPEGTRNHTLNRASYKLGQLIGGGELAMGEAIDELRRAAIASGLDEEEIEQTIESGVQAGLSTPRKRT